MAIDAYLQIDGIKGESADSSHQGWIECEFVTWSIRQSKSATASRAGGHTAARAELSDIIFHKICGLGVTDPGAVLRMGKTKVKFEAFRPDDNGVRVNYYEVELKNVLISHVAQGIGAGGMMYNIGLKFSKVKWKHATEDCGRCRRQHCGRLRPIDQQGVLRCAR